MDWEKKYKEALEKVKKLKHNWALTQNRAAEVFMLKKYRQLTQK